MSVDTDEEFGFQDGNGDWKLRLVVDGRGRSALRLAEANAPREDIANLLQLEAEAFGEFGNYQYTRSLTEASRLGKVAEVQRLLDAGADIHGKDKYAALVGSPVEEAARKKHSDIVEILLNASRKEEAQLGYSLEAIEKAVERGEHDEVTRLQQAKKSLERATDAKNMAFKHAAGAGDLRAVKLLVEHGANVDADAYTGGSRDTALASAAKGGHVEMVNYLIERGVNVNNSSRHHKQSPLKFAARGGHLDIVEKLLAAGSNVNEDRPLHAACIDGHLLVVKRLLKAGAFVDEDHTPYRDGSGELTPLQQAAQGGYLEIVEVLLQAGAKVNLPATRSGRTAFQAAAQSGSLAVVKRLMSAGADVNATPGLYGRTVIQAAAEFGHLEILDTLLDAGANLEETLEWHPVDSLNLAVKGRHVPVINRLLDIGLQKGRPKVDYVNAIHTATEMGFTDIVTRLLGIGTPLVDHGRGSLLLKAAGKGFSDMVQLFVDAGVDINDSSDNYRGTPLQCAVRGGHIDTVRLILSLGPDVNAALGRQKPPIHQASGMKNLEIVKMLLGAGADVHVLTYTGKTALQVAEKGGDQEIIQLLKKHGEKTSAKSIQEESLDVSTVTRREMCPRCRVLPLELFNAGNGGYHSWHPTLTSLQDSARNGCPFCMFFWKQMGITTITIPRSSPVNLRTGTVNESIVSQIDEPYPKDIEYKKRLWCSFNFSVEPFQGKRRSIPGETFSTATLHQLQYWLNNCAANHPTCNTSAEGSFLPTRLLDLGRWSSDRALRLVKGTQIRSSLYMTLSHHWDMDLTPSSRTLASNLESRFNSIDPRSLPQTYLHAIEVTNALHVQYLWIDSLCILQDDKEDWERESSSMNSIFHSSHCTLAANVAEDKSNGLFRSVNVDNDFIELHCTAANGKSKRVRAMRTQRGWQEMYESGPLRKRGWALEERELSPRILHFTSAEVLWECRMLRASQGLPTKDISDDLKPENKRFLDSTGDLGERNIHDMWYLTLVDYTSRQLTKEEDTFPALSGLAKIFNEYVKSEYRAGLWAVDLRRSLAWASHRGLGSTTFSRHIKYVAPTWSWASVNGHTTFSAFKVMLEEVSEESKILPEGMAMINDYSIDLATADPYGRLNSATLSITAPILSAVLGYDASWNNFGQIIQIRDFSGDHILGDVFFDVPSERGSMKVVRCIYLFSNRCRSNSHSRSGQPLGCGLGLALAPVEGEDRMYKRVGHVQCLRLESFRGLAQETFTII